MPDGTLRDLYQRELADLYAVEQQIISALPQLAAAAHSADLRAALERHLERTRVHAERLDFLFKQQGFSKPSTNVSGIDSTIRSGSARIGEYSDPDVKDAAIIGAAQHVEHYEIAGYGCARTFARQLGDDRAADLLQQTLDEEAAADKKLTSIAESGINEAASAGTRERDDMDAERAVRLRYVDIDDQISQRDKYRDVKVRNRAGEQVGRLDGFVVDASGRPYYLVLNTGGLFGGGRHLLPIGRADFNPSERQLMVDLDKDTLKRYPEFHDDEFEEMTDDEARRYEWRILEAIDPEAARSSVASWEYERYPYYQQPTWFDRTAVGALDQNTTKGGMRSPARQARIGRASGEHVVAGDEPDDSETRTPERERMRGRGSDER